MRMRPAIVASSVGGWGGGVNTYGWAVVQARRCDIDCNVQCDWLGRPRSTPNAIPQNTRDICKRDVQTIKQKGGLHRSLGVGYREKDFPLEKKNFLDAWDIMSSNN